MDRRGPAELIVAACQRRGLDWSVDLGVTREAAVERDGGLELRGVWIPPELLDRIERDPTGCFWISDGVAEKVQTFSEQTQLHYGLSATASAPTLMVSGTQMHRTRGIDPMEDTRRKTRAAGPVRGRILDICTGLGYTAIEAARRAEEVVTVERDGAVLEIARRNPWSRELFGNSRIASRIGPAEEVVPRLEGTFSLILHDPPAMAIAGELYSEAFYRELFRLLRPRGRLFHYIGDPESRTGARTTRGVMNRLRAAGFDRIEPRPEAFGVRAHKP